MIKHVYQECSINITEVKVGAASSAKKKSCVRLAVVVTAWDARGLRFKSTVLFPEDKRPTYEWFDFSPGGCESTVFQTIRALVTTTRVVYMPVNTLDSAVQKRIIADLKPNEVRPIESKTDVH